MNNNLSIIKLYESLIFLGIPEEVRLQVWYKLLDIENIVNITIDKVYQNMKIPERLYPLLNKLKEGEKENKKKQLYHILKLDLETKFPFIDKDINLFFSNDVEKQLSVSYEHYDNVKNIAKAYFNWTQLQIITNPLYLKEKIGSDYVYFSGILKLIHYLNLYLKDDYKTFWTLCGLSQVLDIFYQSNPLFMNQLTFVSSSMAILEVTLSII
jgi:hypothetical protein